MLDAFRQRLDVTGPKLSRRSDLAVAVHYALIRWPALTRYAGDGRLEIDNNAAERSLRSVAVCRKNWLFAGSDQGGHRAASIYSLVETTRLNGVDPQAWLTQTIHRIADHPARRIAKLLPWDYQTARRNPFIGRLPSIRALDAAPPARSLLGTNGRVVAAPQASCHLGSIPLRYAGPDPGTIA